MIVKDEFRIVVIAASVGGLEALSCILSELPSAFPLAVAIVQHRSMSSPNLLAELLQRRTKLAVKNAEDGEEIIALVLTGGDGDGADGVSMVKEHGGTVISQDEASARDPSMPRSAIATGDVDCVLPLADIASALEALASRRGLRAEPCVA